MEGAPTGSGTWTPLPRTESGSPAARPGKSQRPEKSWGGRSSLVEDSDQSCLAVSPGLPSETPSHFRTTPLPEMATLREGQAPPWNHQGRERYLEKPNPGSTPQNDSHPARTPKNREDSSWGRPRSCVQPPLVTGLNTPTPTLQGPLRPALEGGTQGGLGPGPALSWWGLQVTSSGEAASSPRVGPSRWEAEGAGGWPWPLSRGTCPQRQGGVLS